MRQRLAAWGGSHRGGRVCTIVPVSALLLGLAHLLKAFLLRQSRDAGAADLLRVFMRLVIMAT